MEQVIATNQIYLSRSIIPQHWHRIFVSGRGVPDLPLMLVLSEIVYWYKPRVINDPVTGEITYVSKFLGDAWQTSYEHFTNKFGFSKEKVRRILANLEKTGIITREFRTVIFRGQKYSNRLFILLKSETLESCISSYSSKKYTTSCDSPVSELEDASPSKMVTPTLKKEGGYPLSRGEYNIDIINNKNNIKDRLIDIDGGSFSSKQEMEGNKSESQSESKSNFFNKSFEKVKNSDCVLPDTSPFCHDDKAYLIAEEKPLQDFYPLSEEDHKILQASSNRAFSLNAMNEILADMAKRLTDKNFTNKRAFLNYMSKALANEMRNPDAINNEDFRIRNNLTEEERSSREREKYLSDIENNPDQSQTTKFKKKIAATLEPSKACLLLKAYKSGKVEDQIYRLFLSKPIELSIADKEIILAQAKAVYDEVNLEKEKFRLIGGLEINVTGEDQETQKDHSILPISEAVWELVRIRLIDQITGGNIVDRNWFSKLRAQINEEAKEIKLKAPTPFIRDWILQNYESLIARACEQEGYRLGGITL